MSENNEREILSKLAGDFLTEIEKHIGQNESMQVFSFVLPDDFTVIMSQEPFSVFAIAKNPQGKVMILATSTAAMVRGFQSDPQLEVKHIATLSDFNPNDVPAWLIYVVAGLDTPEKLD